MNFIKYPVCTLKPPAHQGGIARKLMKLAVGVPLESEMMQRELKGQPQRQHQRYTSKPPPNRLQTASKQP